MAVPVPRRRRFTVDEYYEMARVGILKPDERVELLDGAIVAMNPIGSPHAWGVNRLVELFAPLVGRVRLSVQNPLRLDRHTEPQPDLAILRAGTPQDRHPEPDDVLLVVEVADTSIGIDRGRKRQMYARAGIPEYWIVDLNTERVEVYREPARSRYRSVTLLARGDTISPLFAPDFRVNVTSILGPETTD